MKIWIILLSLAVAAGSWWWQAHGLHAGGQTIRQKLKIVTRSLAAGVAVYFCLMGLALIYLMVMGS